MDNKALSGMPTWTEGDVIDLIMLYSQRARGGIPGPQGPAGPQGSTGAQGLAGPNGYATLTAAFAQPAVGVAVVATVDSTASLGYYEVVYIGGVGTPGGYYRVLNVLTGTQV